MTGTFLSYPPFVRIRTIGRIREGIFREGGSGFLVGFGRSAEARDLAGWESLVLQGREGWRD